MSQSPEFGLRHFLPLPDLTEATRIQVYAGLGRMSRVFFYEALAGFSGICLLAVSGWIRLEPHRPWAQLGRIHRAFVWASLGLLTIALCSWIWRLWIARRIAKLAGKGSSASAHLQYDLGSWLAFVAFLTWLFGGLALRPWPEIIGASIAAPALWAALPVALIAAGLARRARRRYLALLPDAQRVALNDRQRKLVRDMLLGLGLFGLIDLGITGFRFWRHRDDAVTTADALLSELFAWGQPLLEQPILQGLASGPYHWGFGYGLALLVVSFLAGASTWTLLQRSRGD